MGNTVENLRAAFAGESQANRRYLFSAEKADEAGQRQIARLFRAAAEAETVHARNHINVLGELKSTEENLEAAQLNLGISGDRFRAGTINSFNYRDVQLIYLNAALGRLRAIFNLIDTDTALARITGGIVTETDSGGR